MFDRGARIFVGPLEYGLLEVLWWNQKAKAAVQLLQYILSINNAVDKLSRQDFSPLSFMLLSCSFFKYTDCFFSTTSVSLAFCFISFRKANLNNMTCRLDVSRPGPEKIEIASHQSPVQKSEPQNFIKVWQHR